MNPKDELEKQRFIKAMDRPLSPESICFINLSKTHNWADGYTKEKLKDLCESQYIKTVNKSKKYKIQTVSRALRRIQKFGYLNKIFVTWKWNYVYVGDGEKVKEYRWFYPRDRNDLSEPRKREYRLKEVSDLRLDSIEIHEKKTLPQLENQEQILEIQK